METTIRRKIIEMINSSEIFVTNVFVNDQNEVYFTMMERDQYKVPMDEEGNIHFNDVEFVQEFPALEDVPF